MLAICTLQSAIETCILHFMFCVHSSSAAPSVWHSSGADDYSPFVGPGFDKIEYSRRPPAIRPRRVREFQRERCKQRQPDAESTRPIAALARQGQRAEGISDRAVVAVLRAQRPLHHLGVCRISAALG